MFEGGTFFLWGGISNHSVTDTFFLSPRWLSLNKWQQAAVLKDKHSIVHWAIIC